MDVEPGRREQILQAAFEEFAEQGFRGATIKSIGERAGLQSAALIYWYFPDGKRDLFYAAVEAKISFLSVFENPASLLEAPPDEVLPMVAEAYLSFVAEPGARQLFRLLLAEAPRHPGLLEPVVERGPLRVLEFLSVYFTHQIEVGRLRPHDTRSSARAFMGMLVPQALSHVLAPAADAGGPSDEEHIGTAIGIFLRGLAADGAEVDRGSG